jgi:hypothetical protein
MLDLKSLVATLRLQKARMILNNSKDGHLSKRDKLRLAKLLMSLPLPQLRFIIQYLRKKKR